MFAGVLPEFDREKAELTDPIIAEMRQNYVGLADPMPEHLRVAKYPCYSLAAIEMSTISESGEKKTWSKFKKESTEKKVGVHSDMIRRITHSLGHLRYTHLIVYSYRATIQQMESIFAGLDEAVKKIIVTQIVASPEATGQWATQVKAQDLRARTTAARDKLRSIAQRLIDPMITRYTDTIADITQRTNVQMAIRRAQDEIFAELGEGTEDSVDAIRDCVRSSIARESRASKRLLQLVDVIEHRRINIATAEIDFAPLEEFAVDGARFGPRT